MIKNSIPISVSLDAVLEGEDSTTKIPYDKKRLFTISAFAIIIGCCVSVIAKFLVYLIDLFTNISFYGHFSITHANPADNNLGLIVIIIPVLGGIVVGLMAFYGSKAIRGHGIPEAMEQVLINQSKIKPAITYLKPLSAAISVGTGGPFGAEGPIIATGGALGSTLGQLLKITHNERKILLAAGATAGMSAIFGSPIAAIFLAIELLLFEFSPRSFIPVALACITGAAGHHLLFDGNVIFPISFIIEPASYTALGFYCLMGIVIGLFSVLVTKVVYLIEDGFEKLPIHWIWWPAMGGLAVGIIGYFAPRTLGVGYNNITDLLSGTMPIKISLSLCLLKFISWAISLGSGTSGGTLAPLLTIGGATGALLGSLIIFLFPLSGVTVSLAALVGMSAMFAGAARAFLTSIVFALETTGQSNALLPLLATCTTAYFISYFIMENTIMTEKIARRGVKTPHAYEPDVLERITVAQVINKDTLLLKEEKTIKEIREVLVFEKDNKVDYFIVSDNKGLYKGIVSSSSLFNIHADSEHTIRTLVNQNDGFVGYNDTLLTTVETMAKEEVDVLPVISADKNIIGIITYSQIIATYKQGIDEHEKKRPHISLRINTLKILLQGRKIVKAIRRKDIE